VGVHEARKKRSLDPHLATAGSAIGPQHGRRPHPHYGVARHLDGTGPEDRHRPVARHHGIGHVADHLGHGDLSAAMIDPLVHWVGHGVPPYRVPRGSSLNESPEARDLT